MLVVDVVVLVVLVDVVDVDVLVVVVVVVVVLVVDVVDVLVVLVVLVVVVVVSVVVSPVMDVLDGSVKITVNGTTNAAATQSENAMPTPMRYRFFLTSSVTLQSIVISSICEMRNAHFSLVRGNFRQMSEIGRHDRSAEKRSDDRPKENSLCNE